MEAASRINPARRETRRRANGRGGCCWRTVLLLALTLVLGSVAGCGRLAAQTPDQLALDAAIRDFEVGQWERAVGSLTNFIAQFPESPLKTEAMQRERYARAEASMVRGQFAEAAHEFAAYQKEYASHPRAGMAAVREATARLRLGDWAGVLAVLDAPGGAFAAQVQSGAEPGIVLGGLVLKAEALKGEKRLADAEAVLNQAAPFARVPADQWARLQALAAVQEAAGHYDAAAATAEVLGQALLNGGSPERKAEASALAGRLWNRAGNAEGARSAFTRNLSAETPAAFQREAVLQLSDAALARGDLAGARERLQGFLAAHPDVPDVAIFRLRLGQALLRQFLATGGATNTTPENGALLTLAAAEFDAGLAATSVGETAGMLHLGRGWAGWYEAVSGASPERFRPAATNFTAATLQLPPGSSQATARFKLGDTLLRLQEPGAALTNYLAVAEGYPNDAQVQMEFVERALQQAVLAAVDARDAATAGRVVEQLLARQPGATAAGDSTLQVAQALSKLGNNAGARAVLERFLRGYPGSPMAPEVELAAISLDLRAGAWTNAVAGLDRWIGVYTNHPSLIRAEFDRAWAAARAGAATNAVAQFASLAARYPTNAISQTAMLWLAGHYSSLGDYARAEEACVSVLTNAAWVGSPGWHQARLWAAEAARKRQSLGSAREQLVTLLNDRATPTNLVPSALFFLGEILLEQPPAAGQPPLQNYQQALEAFTAAAQYTNSPVAVAALGKMADCHLQLASQSTNSYAKAGELYRRVQESPVADVSARSKAAFGRGVVAEKRAVSADESAGAALLTESLNHYFEILNGGLLRPGEAPDPWWIKEAGREAGRLLETGGRWQDAATLYDRLSRELPAQRAAWESRAAEARRRLSGGSAPSGGETKTAR